MSENNVLYGDSATVKVSFAYGTLAQAASDTYPGGIAFGYDSDTNAGAIFRMGKLVTSRILDITLSNTTTDNVRLITVKYVDTDGLVRTHTFNAVDESLITSLKSRITTLEIDASNGSHDYQAGDYVDIDTDFKISVKYGDIYSKIKNDLTAEGFGQLTAHTVVEEGDYINVETDSSLNKAKVSLDYDSVYSKVKSDLEDADFAKKSDIPSVDGFALDASLAEYAKKTEIPSLDGYALDASLAEYAKKTEIPSLEGYALDASLSEYAKKTDIPSLEGYAKSEDIKEYIGSGYIDVSEGTGDNEGKEVIGIKYTDMYTQIKNDLASAGIGDQTSINEQQSARLLSIENSYTETAGIEDKNEEMKTVSITVKSRTNETEEFKDSSISFDVPTDKYYEDIDSSINNVESRVNTLEEDIVKPASKVEWLDVSALLAAEDA